MRKARQQCRAFFANPPLIPFQRFTRSSKSDSNPGKFALRIMALALHFSEPY